MMTTSVTLARVNKRAEESDRVTEIVDHGVFLFFSVPFFPPLFCLYPFPKLWCRQLAEVPYAVLALGCPEVKK